MDLGLKKWGKFVRYNREFVISEFVITKFHCTFQRYTARSPPKSFIHIDDFASPAKLANYLLYLNSNDTAYEEYLLWKLDHYLYCSEYFCKMCSKLHQSLGIRYYKNDLFWSFCLPLSLSLCLYYSVSPCIFISLSLPFLTYLNLT
jgi:hypothetical protein